MYLKDIILSLILFFLWPHSTMGIGSVEGLITLPMPPMEVMDYFSCSIQWIIIQIKSVYNPNIRWVTWRYADVLTKKKTWPRKALRAGLLFKENLLLLMCADIWNSKQRRWRSWCDTFLWHVYICRYRSSRIWCFVWRGRIVCQTLACGNEETNITMEAQSCTPGEFFSLPFCFLLITLSLNETAIR